MKKSRIAGGSLWLILGTSLNMGSTLLLFGFLSRRLDPSVYGQYRQIWTVGSSLGLLMCLGIPQAVLFFVPQLRSRLARLGTIVRGQLLLVAGGLLGAAAVHYFPNQVSWIFRGDIRLGPLLREYWPVMLFWPIGLCIGILFMAIERPSLSAIVRATFMITVVGAVVVASRSTLDLAHLFRAQTAAGAVFFLLAGFLLIWSTQPRPASPVRDPAPALPATESSTGFARIIRYALPLTLGSFIGAVSGIVDRLVVARSASDAAYAVFANGAWELPVGVILVDAVFTVIQPQLVRHFAAGETGEFVQLWNSAAANIAILVFPVSCLLALLSRDIIHAVYGARYAQSAPIFLMYSLAMMARIQSPDSVMAATGKTKYIMLSSTLWVVSNAALVVIGMRLFGMMGVAVASMVERFLITLVFAWVCCRSARVSYLQGLPWRDLGRTLLATLVTTALCAWIPFAPIPSLARIVLGSVVFAGVYFLIGRRFGVIRDAHLEFVRSFLRKAGWGRAPENPL